MKRLSEVDEIVGTDWQCIKELLRHFDTLADAKLQSLAFKDWSLTVSKRGNAKRMRVKSSVDWEDINDHFVLLPPPEEDDEASHFAVLLGLSYIEFKSKGKSKSDVETVLRTLQIYIVFLNVHLEGSGSHSKLTDDFCLRFEAPHGSVGASAHDYPHVQFTGHPRSMPASEQLNIASLPDSLPAIPVHATSPLEMILVALKCVYSANCRRMIEGFLQGATSSRRQVVNAWRAIESRSGWQVPSVARP